MKDLYTENCMMMMIKWIKEDTINVKNVHTTQSKFLKRWKYQTTLPASWEICMQVKK